jgi:hypothetical protein
MITATVPAPAARSSGRASPVYRTRGLLLVGYLAACTWITQQPAPVRVQGESRDIRQLAGTWRGEFHNSQTGRVGTIFFELRASSDTAYGKVTFDRVVPTTVCTDMTRPQSTSSIVMPVVLDGHLVRGTTAAGYAPRELLQPAD